jgi:hypothetical protein
MSRHNWHRQCRRLAKKDQEFGVYDGKGAARISNSQLDLYTMDALAPLLELLGLDGYTAETTKTPDSREFSPEVCLLKSAILNAEVLPAEE